MKRYVLIAFIIILLLSLFLSIFVIAEKNMVISERTSNTLVEIYRCIDKTKESLQNFIDSEDSSYQSKMIHMINGSFSALYHLCHANRYIYRSACSDFEYIGATFIGPASRPHFITDGIYDDFRITENEREYVKELIALLDMILENATKSDAESDLDTLNSNLEYLNQQLCDVEKSPFRLINNLK